MKKLEVLDLGNCDVLDLSALSGMNKLEVLDLSNCDVRNLRALSSIRSLKHLNLQNAKTTAFPKSILDLNLDFINKSYYSWNLHPGIYISGLVLTDQPIEIFSQSNELIQAYLRADDQVPVNECKVIFLGDAESGKTHSIKRLLNDGEILKNFDGEATPGIEISVSPCKLENTDIVVNYWDFGGQEIQHSMHRMFLTERTVYVVFLNARQDDQMDERARYWLENIKAFAPDAPVLLVINKIDQNGHPRFNETGILSAYGDQIKKVIRMSAKTDSRQVFLSKFRGSINCIIRELPTVSKKIPYTWKSLMESIRTMPDHYLTTEQFIEKCIIHRINDYNEIHDDLVDLFQIIGISFCYYKDRSIADYMLLNPKWMLNALYTIVTNGKTVSKNGVIEQKDLYNLLEKNEVHGIPIRRVLPNVRYSGVEVNYILGVMRMFWLSYRLNNNAEFFPMLCDGDEKISVKKAVPDNALHFVFRYSYLPTNILHRLIVEMQRNLDREYVWYTGAVFNNKAQNQKAYIHSTGNDLHIYVYGEDKPFSLNEYLTPISNTVRNINNDMELTAKELLTFKKNGTEIIIPFKEVIGNLRSNTFTRYDSEIDDFIDYREIAHRYFDERPKKDAKLLRNIINALQIMQNDMTYYRTEANSKGLEDSRNRFVSAQLMAAGYYCSDQLPGGISPSKKAPGKRDFVIRDMNGFDFLIYEGLNLTSLDTSYLNEHLQKLLNNYNPLGLRQSVLVTYLECERDKFKGFTDRYKKHISSYAPESYKCAGTPSEITTSGQFLTCLEMNYETGGLYFLVYHIITRVAP